MNTEKIYNSWAEQYDTNKNKTRDMEAVSLRETLSSIDFKNCLEIGCGTGKNTEWLIDYADKIIAVDFSEEMLTKAKQKINSTKVEFYRKDITEEWSFLTKKVDLVVFSLVLEHIESLEAIFEKITQSLSENGYVYIGELHPFKQYTGTKARFESEGSQQVATCFTHNISDFTSLAEKYGFSILKINEYFDDDDKTTFPRILTLLLQK